MAPAGGAKREVAEVGLELLYLELVKACPQRPVLDAMGVQVGHQLAERYAPSPPKTLGTVVPGSGVGQRRQG
jgi:hypothetical protein